MTALPSGTRNPPPITSRHFGDLLDGSRVREYTLTNRNGMVARILNFGGIITELCVPDRNGAFQDIVLGFDNLQQYELDQLYFGCVIGRVAGRISGGRLRIGDSSYLLPINNGTNHLHGGISGFNRALWSVAIDSRTNCITLSYSSNDGEEGYPGKLEIEVSYTLSDGNKLKVDYSAITDKMTVVNLTQHSYFNLSGIPGSSVQDHWLTVDADHILELNDNSAPTGALLPVAGTPFDLRSKKQIGAEIHDEHEQLELGNGYDHYWVLNKKEDAREAKLAAVLFHEESGRQMEVFTTEPGIQIYSANFLNQSIIGKQGAAYDSQFAICLETQQYPDAPNQPGFPSIVLRPGETYRSTTWFSFTAQPR